MSATTQTTRVSTEPPASSKSASTIPTPTRAFHLDAAGITVIVVHAVAALSLALYTPATKTWILTYAIWQLATLGITVGYHRLWSHRAYKATLPLRALLAVMGAMAFQGSIRWWTQRHRLHHR
ncbi:hypothetical protein BDK51DRAFT_38036 [Blyttiomyces helicus]|uniref:Fatty acid desaturase domain-containing protein n=1 Tax=Blyttiomyces helicus TaxID=388810 RepID=A0A4P9W867_9FUNG|nr:hypothetical protein BDK51DRAFT_38036 [Blyttiomyces helicus]|eukprot:RKO88292.1 hypothetical protein BDK51DRAFT_38036 [Blyttiomyces helicus]